MKRRTSGIVLLVTALACMASEAQTYTDHSDELALLASIGGSEQVETFEGIAPGQAVLDPPITAGMVGAAMGYGDGAGATASGVATLWFQQPVRCVGVRDYITHVQFTVLHPTTFQPLYTGVNFGVGGPGTFAGVCSNSADMQSITFRNPFGALTIHDLVWMRGEVPGTVTICIHQGELPVTGGAMLADAAWNPIGTWQPAAGGCTTHPVTGGRFTGYIYGDAQ